MALIARKKILQYGFVLLVFIILLGSFARHSQFLVSLESEQPISTMSTIPAELADDIFQLPPDVRNTLFKIHAEQSSIQDKNIRIIEDREKLINALGAPLSNESTPSEISIVIQQLKEFLIITDGQWSPLSCFQRGCYIEAMSPNLSALQQILVQTEDWFDRIDWPGAFTRTSAFMTADRYAKVTFVFYFYS